MNQPIAARERYLEIATQRFAESGFHGVSLATLAKDAGVTKQALLHFFATKERLYAEVLAQLSDRLCAAIDLAADSGESPEARLLAYFDAHAATPDGAQDARLVIRALLDSRAKARHWPLKPYLDKLIALARGTARWRDAADEDVLSGLYQLLGAMQYFAISRETLSGMYGDAAVDKVRRRFADDFRSAVRGFLTSAR